MSMQNSNWSVDINFSNANSLCSNCGASRIIKIDRDEKPYVLAEGKLALDTVNKWLENENKYFKTEGK